MEEDIIKIYMRDIGAIPQLTEKEEKELGMLKTKDAINKLVESNLRLVPRIVKMYKNPTLPYMDMV